MPTASHSTQNRSSRCRGHADVPIAMGVTGAPSAQQAHDACQPPAQHTRGPTKTDEHQGTELLYILCAAFLNHYQAAGDPPTHCQRKTQVTCTNHQPTKDTTESAMMSVQQSSDRRTHACAPPARHTCDACRPPTGQGYAADAGNAGCQACTRAGGSQATKCRHRVVKRQLPCAICQWQRDPLR